MVQLFHLKVRNNGCGISPASEPSKPAASCLSQIFHSDSSGSLPQSGSSASCLWARQIRLSSPSFSRPTLRGTQAGAAAGWVSPSLPGPPSYLPVPQPGSPAAKGGGGPRSSERRLRAAREPYRWLGRVTDPVHRHPETRDAGSGYTLRLETTPPTGSPSLADEANYQGVGRENVSNQGSDVVAELSSSP